MEGKQETVPKLLIGTNFNDFEWPLTQISRSRYYSTTNNSKMVQDRATFTMADQYGLLNGAIFTVKHTKVRTAAYKKNDADA